MDKVTKFSNNVAQAEMNLIEGLFTGIIQSDCPVPCTSTSILTLNGPVTSWINPAVNNYSMITISFDLKVIITKNVVYKFNFMTSLNFSAPTWVFSQALEFFKCWNGPLDILDKRHGIYQHLLIGFPFK